MSLVRPDWETLPRPSTQAANTQCYDAGMVGVSQKLNRKCYTVYCTHQVLNLWPLVCESNILWEIYIMKQLLLIQQFWDTIDINNKNLDKKTTVI